MSRFLTLLLLGLAAAPAVAQTVNPGGGGGSSSQFGYPVSANQIFAGPATGSPAIPAFRGMSLADLPYSYTTVNGTTCTLGSTCTVSTASIPGVVWVPLSAIYGALP